MKDLAVRLAALDADAGAALRVIAYFDTLVEARAGLTSIVRGAAMLADCPARLVDEQRRVRVRVTRQGESAWADGPPDPAWPSIAAGPATLTLEKPGPPGPVGAMILERAAGAAKAVLDRTRGRTPAPDPASVELVVDASAPPDVRLQAARRLGLDPAGTATAAALETGPQVFAGPPPSFPGRVGVGPAVPVPDLPSSWAAARTALRFAADGTDEDPGPTVVHHADLGALALLADLGDQSSLPDVRALDHAAAAAPWMPATLQAVADSISLRAAATALRVHHSTLQDRIAHAEHLLGWTVRDPHGRLRLQLALALRRLRRHP
ncbi:helix-turn-helix domain-containing protein [Couchioplanes caeruleus]|uniref:helix-turn-helix domain-containing protein n=1 Tax=Couchioplanes caeruleus TaxID=56438 RepID=UPI0020BD7C7E|nr:helix-turn-helix domain-containing protein [Couchioplanes caeruleus]UQU63887.1 helix-turn-helix domain-containing protein [Couchioplanes caeruleus]